MIILRLLCACSLFLPLCPSQVSTAPEVRQPTEVIEGAKEPDRIEDNVAWFMLFKLLASGPNRFPRETRARFLKDSGLSENQISTVIVVADEVADEIQQMEKRVKGSDLAMEAKTAMLRAERAAIIQSAVNDLLVNRVDYDGGQKLKRHIDQRIKTAITVAR